MRKPMDLAMSDGECVDDGESRDAKGGERAWR